MYEASIDSTNFLLVDTPGFDDTYMSDYEVLKKIAEWLKSEFEAGQLLKGIIYLHPITKNRMEGSALRTLSLLERICGQDNWKSVVLATTFWDTIPKEKGIEREKELTSEGTFWRTMIEQGSQVQRIDKNYDDLIPALLEIAKQPSITLQIQEEMSDGKPLEEIMADFFIGEDTKETKPGMAENKSKHSWWDIYKANRMEAQKNQHRVEQIRRKREAEELRMREAEISDTSRLRMIEQAHWHAAKMKMREIKVKKREAEQREVERERIKLEEEIKLKRKAAENRAVAGYNASLIQMQTVESDIDLLRAANAVGLVRIDIKGLASEGVGMLVEAYSDKLSVERSPLNRWCDGCQQIIGARVRIGKIFQFNHFYNVLLLCNGILLTDVVCEICPGGRGRMNYCLDCYNDGEGSCFNQDHQLYSDDSSLRWRCQRAIYPYQGSIRCSSEDCRRGIKGLYFRKFAQKWCSLHPIAC
jgi:hypothetical protein